MKSVAVVLPRALSAALYCTPALASLGSSVRITCLTASTASRQIARSCPGVSEVIDVSGGVQLAELGLQVADVYWLDIDSADTDPTLTELIQQLAAQGSRTTRFSESAAYQTMASHPAMRIRDWLLGEVVSESTPPSSESDRGYPLTASADAQARVDRLFPDTRPILIMHLGCHGISAPGWRFWRTAGHPNGWPIDGFLQVGAALRQVFDEPRIVLTGLGVENELTQPFARQIPDSMNLVDQTDVPLLLALADRADIVIGNLTGPVHLACATSTCVVAIAREGGEPGNLADDGQSLFPESASRRIAQAADLASVSPAKVLSECLIALKSAGRLPA